MPAIAATLSPLVDAHATDAGEFRPYTVPALAYTDSDGKPTCIMGSLAIVRALDRLHPSPSIGNLDDLTKISRLLDEFANTPMTPDTVLASYPASRAYWVNTRINEMGPEPAQADSDKLWQQSMDRVQALTDLYAGSAGPFLAGREPSYADFLFAAELGWLRATTPETFERLIADDDTRVLAELWQASQRYLPPEAPIAE